MLYWDTLEELLYWMAEYRYREMYEGQKPEITVLYEDPECLIIERHARRVCQGAHDGIIYNFCYKDQITNRWTFIYPTKLELEDKDKKTFYNILKWKLTSHQFEVFTEKWKPEYNKLQRKYRRQRDVVE